MRAKLNLTVKRVSIQSLLLLYLKSDMLIKQKLKIEKIQRRN
jgi:hypothetical protein